MGMLQGTLTLGLLQWTCHRGNATIELLRWNYYSVTAAK